jgi:hypothetical protein
VPTGLTPGSQYRLAFVTAGTFTATDGVLADYNSDVTTEANTIGLLATLGTTWADLGSSATVNATTNIGQDPSIPIYNLAGMLVADDATANAGGLFSDNFINPIDVTETGGTLSTRVWTGSDRTGLSLGSTFAFGGGNPIYGASSSTTNGINEGNPGGNGFSYSLYAISGVLTVSSPTPEPSTFGMIAVAFVAALSRRQRKRLTR